MERFAPVAGSYSLSRALEFAEQKRIETGRSHKIVKRPHGFFAVVDSEAWDEHLDEASESEGRKMETMQMSPSANFRGCHPMTDRFVPIGYGAARATSAVPEFETAVDEDD